jgi:hypothetical protein
VQLAWIIAFVSSIISATSTGDARFPNYSWWTLVFLFFCIIGVTVTVASEAERTYHVAVGEAYPRRTMHLLISRRLSVSLERVSSSPLPRSTRSFTRPSRHSRPPLPATYCSP